MLRATAFGWPYSLGFLLIDMHGKGWEIMVGLVFILIVPIDITLDLQADILFLYLYGRFFFPLRFFLLSSLTEWQCCISQCLPISKDIGTCPAVANFTQP